MELLSTFLWKITLTIMSTVGCSISCVCTTNNSSSALEKKKGFYSLAVIDIKAAAGFFRKHMMMTKKKKDLELDVNSCQTLMFEALMPCLQ